MIIILEGVDCTGKTTLINKLIEKQNTYAYRHADKLVLLDRLQRGTIVSPEKRTKDTDSFSIITEIKYLKALHNRMNLVLDRFHFSHYIYALTRRGYELNFINEIDYELSKLDVKLFLITTDDEILRKRLLKEKDEISYRNKMKEESLMLEMFRKSKIINKHIIENNYDNDINVNKVWNIIWNLYR